MEDGSRHWRCQKVMACGLTSNSRHGHRTWASSLLACFASLKHSAIYFRVDARACLMKMLLGKLQEIPINLIFFFDWHVLESLISRLTLFLEVDEFRLGSFAQCQNYRSQQSEEVTFGILENCRLLYSQLLQAFFYSCQDQK